MAQKLTMTTLLVALRTHGKPDQFVAQIVKQPAAADSYQSSFPWLLLLNDGRVRRFPSMIEAKTEAQKLWAPCRFTRSIV